MGRKFSPEFKEEAIKLVVEQGMSARQAAEDLGIGKSSLENWVRFFRKCEQEPNKLKETERTELNRLRKENHQLRTERDLLKKTAIYFAKNTPGGVNS